MPAPPQSPLLPSLREGPAAKLGEVYPMGLGEITNFSPFWAASADKARKDQALREWGLGGSRDPRAARTIAPRRAALLGERNLGCLGGVPSPESRSHWDLNGKLSMARTAGHVSPNGGSWMDPPSSISTLVVELRGLIPGKTHPRKRNLC